MIRLTLVALLAVACSTFVLADEPKSDFERWEKDIAAIEQRDQEQKVTPGTTVFVGSSSIRLWDLKKSFPDRAAVNHGFGGSTIADAAHFVDRLVLKLKPKIVVFYSGDNDIAGGKSPEQVHADFEVFL